MTFRPSVALLSRLSMPPRWYRRKFKGPSAWVAWIAWAEDLGRITQSERRELIDLAILYLTSEAIADAA